MTSIQAFWQRFTGKGGQDESAETSAISEPSDSVTLLDLDIASNDPLLHYFQNSPGAVDISKLLIQSPALSAIQSNGVKMVVPLVSQGELIGLINLGPRLSEQEYSTDDRKLLNDLATQAAPAVRVAQLARQQLSEARERERFEQELRVASLIQQTLLPEDVPHLDGYDVVAYYQPAREVGGDFYDFLYFDNGRVGLVIGDVTDKGVPAALVMATTRTLIRAAAERLESPGLVLERVNDLLHPDIPPRMFVTCLYAVLDPESGRLQYANAGHDLPYVRRQDGVGELRATGMPLGLMPGMTYEEKEIVMSKGETILFHSDGLVEAHDPDGEMFGFPKLKSLMASHPGGASLVEYLLEELAQFTGPGWEQEDDVTFVSLELQPLQEPVHNPDGGQHGDQILSPSSISLEIPSQPGNERRAMEEVAAIIEPLDLANDRLEKLKTAVAEATMNAMEHGNKYQPEKPVYIEVVTTDKNVVIRVTDHGGGQPISESEAPDLDAKLDGLQSPRGWGLFLIKNMVDEMNIESDDSHHTVELIVNLVEETAHDGS
jgi:serine phosphatase RsbU (regulator of sigma subunit)/anti-sigma regulatory factor (Ser/Thr protein kinase)